MSRRHRAKQLHKLMELNGKVREAGGPWVHPLAVVLALRQRATMDDGVLYVPMNGLETFKTHLPLWVRRWWPVQFYVLDLGIMK